MNAHREAVEAEGEQESTVRVGVDVHHVGRGEEELGGMGNDVGVDSPCRDFEDRHVGHVTSLRSEVLHLTEWREQELHRRAMPGMVGDAIKLEGDEEEGGDRIRASSPAPGVEDNAEARRADTAEGDAGAEQHGRERRRKHSWACRCTKKSWSVRPNLRLSAAATSSQETPEWLPATTATRARSRACSAAITSADRGR